MSPGTRQFGARVACCVCPMRRLQILAVRLLRLQALYSVLSRAHRLSLSHSLSADAVRCAGESTKCRPRGASRASRTRPHASLGRHNQWGVRSWPWCGRSRKPGWGRRQCRSGGASCRAMAHFACHHCACRVTGTSLARQIAGRGCVVYDVEGCSERARLSRVPGSATSRTISAEQYPRNSIHCIRAHVSERKPYTKFVAI